jgi:hypothetical protein
LSEGAATDEEPRECSNRKALANGLVCFSDAEQMEALAILPFVLMAQIKCIQATIGGYSNVARRVGSTAEPRRRPVCIAVCKTLHLQVLRVIAVNFVPGGKWLRILREVADPEHF